MQTWKGSRRGRLALASLIGLLFCLSADAKTDLEDGWEYRWGDSPFSESGEPAWIADAEPEQWQPIAFPSNPPGRDDRHNVWYRITLPESTWQDPVLYIYSVDLIVQVWLDGKNIYQYGHFDEHGKGQFEGWPWHAIPLPKGFEGKDIYFRIFSDYTDIGLWGEVSILESPELTLFILNNSLKALIIGGFSALIAALAIIFSLLQARKKSFASIAFFAISSAVLLIAESQASQLIFNAPLVWDFLAAGSYFLLPVAMLLLLEQWFTEYQPRIINLLWKIHLAYFVISLTLAGFGVIDLSSTFPPLDLLLLVSLAVTAFLVIREFRRLGREQQAIVVAYGFFCSLLVLDMAVAHGFLPFWRVPVSWGALVFSLSVVVISLVHYARTQEAIQRLNQSLEEKVAERTAKAESLVRREQARVRLLSFENEKTRVLNDIIAAIQDSINLGQTFPILARRLPDFCSPMQGKLYQRVDDGRAYQLLTRWGYAGEPASEERIQTPYGPPAQSDLALKHSSSKDATASSMGLKSGSEICFWISVQSATEGLIPIALLFVKVPEEFVSDDTYFGAVRLFQVLNEGIERIGITLSGIKLREDLQKYSYEDALTGLKNRRYFDQLFEHETAVAIRRDRPMAVLMIDIDHFKRFNDTHGHEAGDSALKCVANLLIRHFRDSDVVCRFGGEEFVAVMAGTNLKSARAKAFELIQEARKLPITHRGAELQGVTLSIGVSSWPECTETPDSLLGHADRALYRAKDAGRDRVEVD